MTTATSKTLSKYLNTYAEREVDTLAQLLEKVKLSPFTYSLAIPAYDENPGFIDRWMQHPQAHEVLLIVVINQPDSVPHETPQNIALFSYLQQNFTPRASAENLSYLSLGSSQALVVDRYRSNKIPKGQGVGLARKIACDLAVKLYESKFQTRPWIYSSDADAILPGNYFSAPSKEKHSTLDKTNSAIVFDFKHIVNTEHDNKNQVFDATQRYEQSLKYFRNRLIYANSPYAFYTLGSTLAVNIQHYCQVRGFPKRAGGEDFYILNKLAKLGKVHSCDDICIKLTSRLSHRVPFGTGPAVSKIIDLQNTQQSYDYYNPKIFDELKAWLENYHQLWAYIEDIDNFPWPSQRCKATMERLKISSFLSHAAKQCKY